MAKAAAPGEAARTYPSGGEGKRPRRAGEPKPPSKANALPIVLGSPREPEHVSRKRRQVAGEGLIDRQLRLPAEEERLLKLALSRTLG